MIDYTSFTRALQYLEGSWLEFKEIDYSKDRKRLIFLKQMGLIKAYELCFLTLKKALRRHLVEAGESNIKSAAKSLFIAAVDNDLLRSSVDQWIKYIDMYNATVHEYSDGKIDDLIRLLPDFIDDAIGIHQAMTNKPWG